MALNGGKVGWTYPSYPYEVSREKIREYAAAVGETDPRYFSDGDDCVAPPTFAACFTVTKGWQVAFDDPDLGTHPSLVHGSQRFVFGTRPLRPGDQLTCTTRIADISVRAGNELLVVEVDARFDGSEELAVRAEATIVFLRPPNEAAAAVQESPPGADADPGGVAPAAGADEREGAA